ncbi:MAG: hypothetical protein QM669_12415 [Siphonobacter sp.]
MLSILTDDSEPCRPSKQGLTLPEFICGNGIRIKVHGHFGMWLVSTRGDVILTRMRYVLEGKIEKETRTEELIITYDRLTAKNWPAYVFSIQQRKGIDMNQFFAAYTLALDLIGYEMGDLSFKPII